MFDYRLFFAGSTLDGSDRERRAAPVHEEKRVYRLPTIRREARPRQRR
jgi:hypothetical protein